MEDAVEIAKRLLMESLEYGSRTTQVSDTSSISPWHLVDAERLFLECDLSLDIFCQRIEESADNLPMWITHPTLYSLLKSYSIRMMDDAFDELMNDELYNTSSVGIVSTLVNEMFENITGVRYIDGEDYMRSYDNAVVDEEKLMVWRMSH